MNMENFSKRIKYQASKRICGILSQCPWKHIFFQKDSSKMTVHFILAHMYFVLQYKSEAL